MTDGPIPLEETVRLAAEGEQDALARIVDRFHNRLFRYVFFRVGSVADAEDLTQDIWVKVFHKLSGLRDPCQFGSWLFRIARNRCADYYRRKKVRKLVGLSDRGDEDSLSVEERLATHDPDGLEEMLRKDFWKRLKALLNKLSGREREVFVSRYLDQLSIKEIADVMGTSESSVKTYLYRGLRKVRSSPLFSTVQELSYGEKNIGCASKR